MGKHAYKRNESSRSVAPFRRGQQVLLTYGTAGHGGSIPRERAPTLEIKSVVRNRIVHRIGDWRIYAYNNTTGTTVSELDLEAL